MAWNLFVDKHTGDLVSEGVAVPDELDTDRYEVITLPERPDHGEVLWNSATRQFDDRPPPVLIDRLDDIEQRFLADPDFRAVWDSLNATRKQQLRTGILRVLAGLLKTKRYRQEADPVDLD